MRYFVKCVCPMHQVPRFIKPCAEAEEQDNVTRSNHLHHGEEFTFVTTQYVGQLDASTESETHYVHHLLNF